MNGDRTDGGMEAGRGLVCIDPNAPTLRERMWPVVASNVFCLQPLLVGLVVSALYASFLTAGAFSDDGYKDAFLRHAFEYVRSNGVDAARTFWLFFALSLGLWYLLLAGTAMGIVQFYARVQENCTEWKPLGSCLYNLFIMYRFFSPLSRSGFGHSTAGVLIFILHYFVFGYDDICNGIGKDKDRLFVFCICFAVTVVFFDLLPIFHYDINPRMFFVRTLLAAAFSVPFLWGRRRDASTFFAFLTAYVCILTYGYGVFTGAFLMMTGGTSWPPFFLMLWDRAFHVNVWGFLIWFALFSSGLQLDALVKAPTTSPVPKRYQEGGYIKSVPDDPWGNPYIYRNKNGRVQIVSTGPDGEEGGEGNNADITNDD